MQPIELARRQPGSPGSPPPPLPPPLVAAADGRATPPRAHRGSPVESPRVHLAGPALLVEARFRDITLASRLLRAGAAATFTIGAARGVDAPVNPSWLGEPLGEPSIPASPAAPARHVLVESAAGGFALHLAPAMRAELRTPLQRLSLSPDFGRAESPLVLPPDSSLHIACGEMTFEIRAAGPVAALPRPWLGAGWRDQAMIFLAVAFVLLALVAVATLMAPDRRALSLDDLEVSRRFAAWVTLPPETNEPPIDRALAWLAPSGGATNAAAGNPTPTGQAGNPKAPRVDVRRAAKGQVGATNARDLAERTPASGLLGALEGSRADALLATVARGPTLGADADDVLGRLTGTTIADAYGVGGLGIVGENSGGGGLGDGLVGLGHLDTLGRYGGGHGTGPGYGAGVGRLAIRQASVPDAIPGIGYVRGTLDKEIIRRVVRRHLNEVRYCYEQALLAHPSLSGRLVVQFTIAPTGRVLASTLQSSTLTLPSVEACVVQAVGRWEFPQPEHGGLALVSYPFQLTPGS